MCLTESAGKGDLGHMSKVQMLEEELSRSKEENKRLQKLLDAVLQPQLRIHRAGLFPLLFINTLNSVLFPHLDHIRPGPDVLTRLLVAKAIECCVGSILRPQWLQNMYIVYLKKTS